MTPKTEDTGSNPLSPVQFGSTCPCHNADANAAGSSSSGQQGSQENSGSNNGFSVVAQALAGLGIKHMYGVVGIPVTELASAAQVCSHPLCVFTLEA